MHLLLQHMAVNPTNVAGKPSQTTELFRQEDSHLLLHNAFPPLQACISPSLLLQPIYVFIGEGKHFLIGHFRDITVEHSADL